MDFYDSQALGVIVFGAFMLVSAVGIFLVSTLFVKETSYEEALAKRRRELEKATQPKAEKKKREKPAERRGRARRKEEKPNGRLSEPDSDPDASEAPDAAWAEPVSVTSPPALEAPVPRGSAPPPEPEKPHAPLPKDKKKARRPAKAEAVPSPPAAAPRGPPSDAAPKEGPAGPPSEDGQKAPLPGSVAGKSAEAGEQGELQRGGPSPQRAPPRRKKDPGAADGEGASLLPYKALLPMISEMALSEGEAQQLADVLAKKAGATQGPWQVKGDPLVVLKQQLEEKEKQLGVEQENLVAAKAKLRELSKELAAEKARTLASEHKLKEELAASRQEVSSLHAQAEGSAQELRNEAQQLQGKIQTLQEQLENGPNAQLARVQQENSILRDALNQATSQTESKQNAELAKLRQECNRLGKELAEKSESRQRLEEQKQALEARSGAYEKQVHQLQASLKENEASEQKSLNEISEKLCRSQASCQDLQAELEKIKEQQGNAADLQSTLLASEREVERNAKEMDALRAQLAEAASRNLQLADALKRSEGRQTQGAEEHAGVQKAVDAGGSLMELRSQKSFPHVSPLGDAGSGQEDVAGHPQAKSNDTEEPRLGRALAQTKEALRSLFPQVALGEHQVYEDWLQRFKEKALEALQEKEAKIKTEMEGPQAAEAAEALRALQAECDQYRTVLAETEKMLRDLQKSVQEEQEAWEGKLSASEEALRKLRGDASHLEAQLEDQAAAADSQRQEDTKEIETLRLLLSESQERLEEAERGASRHSQELSQAQDLANGLQAELERERGHRVAAAAERDDILQLQETLEREKRLTQDLGCAATKLKELLKATQGQLATERETASKLQQQLREKGENEKRTTEGTSV